MLSLHEYTSGKSSPPGEKVCKQITIGKIKLRPGLWNEWVALIGERNGAASYNRVQRVDLTGAEFVNTHMMLKRL